MLFSRSMASLADFAGTLLEEINNKRESIKVSSVDADMSVQY